MISKFIAIITATGYILQAPVRICQSQDTCNTSYKNMTKKQGANTIMSDKIITYG